MPEQLSFGDPEPTSVPSVEPTSDGAAVYRPYRTINVVRCDDCMALHVRGPAPLARRATTVRIVGKRRRLLCPEHAQEWRDADEKREKEEERERAHRAFQWTTDW